MAHKSWIVPIGCHLYNKVLELALGKDDTGGPRGDFTVSLQGWAKKFNAATHDELWEWRIDKNRELKVNRINIQSFPAIDYFYEARLKYEEGTKEVYRSGINRALEFVIVEEEEGGRFKYIKYVRQEDGVEVFVHQGFGTNEPVDQLKECLRLLLRDTNEWHYTQSKDKQPGNTQAP